MDRREIVIGAYLGRPREKGDRTLELALHEQEAPVVEVRLVEIRLKRKGSLEFDEGFLISPVLMQRQAARGVGLSQVWIERKRLGAEAENPLQRILSRMPVA
jgi:hypothetical protein